MRRNGYLAGAVGLASLFVNPLVVDVVHAQTVTELKVEDEEKSTPYELIEKYAIKDFLREYLVNVSQKSDSFAKRIKKYGGLENYLDVYAKNHEMLLLQAMENRESDEDFYKASARLAKNMGMDGGSVDYEDDEVRDALNVWARVRVELFNKLLEAKKPKHKGYEGFKEMVREVYNDKTFNDWLKKQHRANNKLYDSMLSTLNVFERTFGGNWEIEVIREETKKVYDSTKRWAEDE